MSAPVSTDPWTIDVVDEVDVGGWLLVPPRMDADQQRRWVAAGVEAIYGFLGPEGESGEPIGPGDLRPVVEAAIAVRAASEAVAVFQVWPVRAPAAVMCQINLVPSDDLPEWTEAEGVVIHPVDAPHLGPGLQCTVSRTEDDDGEPVQMMSMHLVFDDGTTTIILSLQESIPFMIAAAMPAFDALKDVVRARRADGSTFVALAPAGVDDDEAPWQLEETP